MTKDIDISITVRIGNIERVLDPFHIKRAVRSAYGDALDTKPLFDNLFRLGFDSVSDQLKALISKGKPAIQKQRRNCFAYLSNHKDEILPLSERPLPFDKLDSLGCMESNIGKTIALRMKTRGCSWSLPGAEAMSSILCHLPELEDHSFLYEKFRKFQNIHYKQTKPSKSLPQPSVHQASFPIVNSGRTSAPFFKLFKDIIFD